MHNFTFTNEEVSLLFSLCCKESVKCHKLADRCMDERAEQFKTLATDLNALAIDLAKALPPRLNNA